MKHLQKLWQRVQSASSILSKAINKEFPPGSRVVANWGGGKKIRGIVAFEAHGSTVAIRTGERGKVHHKHFSDVVHEGE